MSGFEVAGLVLGAFPLAIEILGRYTEVKRRFRIWYDIKGELNHCIFELQYQQHVYENNLRALLLPLVGLDDADIDKLLQDAGGQSWTEASNADALKTRLGNSHELYMQCMSQFQECFKALHQKWPFNPTEQIPQEVTSPEQETPQMSTKTLSEYGKRQWYRLKFSQTEKERDEIFAKLEKCNVRLEKLLRISGDHTELVRQRAAPEKRPINAVCQFWQQARRVFTALSTVWSCNCPAQHSTGLLLKHRNSATDDFQLLYHKSAWVTQDSRKIKITEETAESGNSALSIASSPTADDGSLAARGPKHRTSTPIRSAMRNSTALPTGATRSQPSITITRVQSSSSSTSATKRSGTRITNLCVALQCPDGQLCGFMAEQDYRYDVYHEPGVPHHSHPLSVITLDQLLQKNDLPALTRRQRVAMAFILSSSFLQLLESPWLPGSWQRSDIVFFEDPDRVGVFKLDEPHLESGLHRRREPGSLTGTNLKVELSWSLKTLGIVLLELCFGELLREQTYRLQYPETGDSSKDRAIDVIAAKEWLGEVEEEAGENYSIPVAWCLEGLSTPYDRWREEMLSEVVLKLEWCYKCLQRKVV